MKSGSGKASDFTKLANLFKGKDDQIHAALTSIADVLGGNKPATFVKSQDDSIDFGGITDDMAKAMRRQSGKIRLEVGDETYGEKHIELRHGKDIRALGFDGASAFVTDIAKHIDQVWQPRETAQLVAIHQVKNDRVMFVELRQAKDEAGDYYTVRSAFPARVGFLKNKKWNILWEGRAQPSTNSGKSAPFAEPSLTEAGRTDTIPSGKANSPTSTSEATSADGEKLGDQPTVGTVDNIDQPVSKIKPADPKQTAIASNHAGISEATSADGEKLGDQPATRLDYNVPESKPASEMSAAELLRAAANKMDAEKKPAQDKELTQAVKGEKPPSDNEKFNSDLDSYLSGKFKSGSMFVLGKPGKILSQFGLGNLEIQMPQSIVRKGINKHSVKAKDLRDLPSHIQSPLAVFASKSNPDARILLTEIDHPEGSLVIVLHAQIERGKLLVHDIRSIHPKSGEKITRWVEDGLLLGLDKNKGRHLLPATPEYNSQGKDNEATSSIILYETGKKGNKRPASADGVTDDGVALFSLSPRVNSGGGVSLAVADRVVASIVAAKKSWNVEITAAATFETLPPDVQETTKNQYGEETAHNAKGVAHNGKVYIIAANNESEADVESTVLHEVEGHIGTHRLYGKDVIGKLNALYMAIGGLKGLKQIVEQRDIKSDIEGYAAVLNDSAKLTGDQKIAVIMDEVLAHYAQHPKFGDRVKSIVGAIKAWLRNNGFVKLAAYGETDLLNILREGRKHLKTAGEGDNTTLLMISQNETKETDKGVALYSAAKGGVLPESEWMSESSIAQVVEERLAQFAHQPKVFIRNTERDVLGDASRNDGIATSGMVYKGGIYMFRDGLADTSAVSRTLWHEILHYGLRRFLTKEQYIAKLNGLYMQDGWIRKNANAWMATEHGKQIAVKDGNVYARARGVDEALAYLAETNMGEFQNSSVVAKAIRTVARWVAKLADTLGFKEAAVRWNGVTNDEARDLVLAMFRKLKNDEPATSSDLAFTADPAFMSGSETSNALTTGVLSSKPATLQSVESVTKATARLRASWLGFRSVNIVQSVREIPNDLYLRALRAHKPIDMGTEGIYDPLTRSVYLIADNLATPERAVWVAAHEVVGHGGVRMLGGRVDEAVDNAAKNNMVKKLSIAIAADRGEKYEERNHIDEAVAELAAGHITGDIDSIFKRYGVKVPNMMLGHIRGLIKNVVDALHNFMNKVLKKNAAQPQIAQTEEDREEVSDKEILGLIRRMKGLVEGKDLPSDSSNDGSVPASSKGKQSAESFARMALEEIAAENDKVFDNKVSNSNTIDGVVLDVMKGAEYLGEDTHQDERSESHADHRYVFKTPNNKTFYVYETDEGEVWVNVSQLEPGSGGGAIYAAVANYTYNTHKKFIGDPFGLSPKAVIRRTSHMLSSALRFGTTRHLEAAKQQEWGAPEDGVEPLDWTGSDIDKLEALIHTFTKTADNFAPSLKDYHYDFQTAKFSDAQGRSVTGAAMASNTPRDAGIGEKTARRVVLLRSVLSADSSPISEGRGAILERVLHWGDTSTPGSLHAIFSRKPQKNVVHGNRASDAESSPEESFPSKARVIGIPKSVVLVADFRNDIPLKHYVDYRAAKGGDISVAFRLTADLVKPESIAAAKEEFGDDVAYLPVMALEASGDNQIPNALASHYAAKAGGKKGSDIYQTNKAYHTGADAMGRMIARAEFGGKVIPSQKYVLVDDMSTMGGTLSDMASYIQSNGGQVVGIVLLTNASRAGTITPNAIVIRSLEKRHGQTIRELFGIEPSALTRDEAQYLIGFRTTDELRNRAASAIAERSRRIRSKDVSGSQDTQALNQSGDEAPLSSRAPSQQSVLEDSLPEAEWLSVGSIVEEVDKLLQPFVTEIPILVRDTLSDIGVKTADDGVTSGAVHGGRIHLFRDGLTDRAAVVRTLWHELLHFGFRRFMTEQQYIAKMGELYMKDGWVRGKASAWMKTDEAKKLAETKSPAYVRARAVDEALAELAEIMQLEPTGYQNLLRPVSLYTRS